MNFLLPHLNNKTISSTRYNDNINLHVFKIIFQIRLFNKEMISPELELVFSSGIKTIYLKMKTHLKD